MKRRTLKSLAAVAALVAVSLVLIWIIHEDETRNSTAVLCKGNFPGKELSQENLARLIENLPNVRALYYMRPYISWKLKQSIALGFDAYHPQGLLKIDKYKEILSKKDSSDFLMTTVDKRDRVGYLIRFECNREVVQPIERTPISIGLQIHPGGMDYDVKKGLVWFALAEYHKQGPSTIVSVNPYADDLRVDRHFLINDHIGTMMCDAFDQSLNLYLVDWSVSIYTVRVRGDHAIPEQASLSNLYKFRLTEDYEYQDCKHLGGHFFLCAGKAGGVLGYCKPGRLVILYILGR